jgi:hypothetical protein
MERIKRISRPVWRACRIVSGQNAASVVVVLVARMNTSPTEVVPVPTDGTEPLWVARTA